MNDEIWKMVPESNGKYMVSSHGRIAKILRPSNGIYVYADMYVGSIKHIRKLLHRLILEVFIGPPPSKNSECNHKDGNKKNNKLTNLEWVSPSENRYHSYRVLRNKAKSGETHPNYGKFGGANSTSKEYFITSPTGEKFKVRGLKNFCLSKGLDVGTMSNIANKRYGCKTHKGWRCEHA